MKEEMTQDAVQENGTLVEGRNAVLEAFRSGKTIDKLYVLDGCKDGPVQTIVREARKHDTIINFVAKERLDQLSATGHHQGVIAQASAYEYATVEDIRALAPITKAVLETGAVCVIGNEDKIKADSGLFKEIKPLFA